LIGRPPKRKPAVTRALLFDALRKLCTAYRGLSQILEQKHHPFYWVDFVPRKNRNLFARQETPIYVSVGEFPYFCHPSLVEGGVLFIKHRFDYPLFAQELEESTKELFHGYLQKLLLLGF
jgi:hypothetical protein